MVARAQNVLTSTFLAQTSLSVNYQNNASDFTDLSPTIPDDRECLRNRQNLGRSGNSEIPDLLGFSRHSKTRLKQIEIVKKLKMKFKD